MVVLFALIVFSTDTTAEIFHSEKTSFKITPIAKELEHPWGLAFLPNGDALITERTGQLRHFKNGKLIKQPVGGLPEIHQHGQGGLLGIALHPNFTSNRLIYLSYAGKGQGGYSTEVLRGKWNGERLEQVEVIFVAQPKSHARQHFGSRLVFTDDGSLFISYGDRGASPALNRQHPSQHLDSHTGSLLRIKDNGAIPADNPFIRQTNAYGEIYSYGHRNIQGMTKGPDGRIWLHEHGPQGGDEINMITAGANYGWPVITYGVNYGLGTRIGEGTHQRGMRQPLYYWVPSIAPSGMSFYTGDAFPQWKNNLFVGSLKFGLLVRLELEKDRVVHEERLLDNRYGRIRDVVQGPDDFLYLLTDSTNGMLLKIEPYKN